MLKEYLKLSKSINTQLTNMLLESITVSELNLLNQNNLEILNVKFKLDTIKNLGIKKFIIPDTLSMNDNAIIRYSNLSKIFIQYIFDLDWKIISEELLEYWNEFQTDILNFYIDMLNHDSQLHDLISILKNKCFFLLLLDLDQGELKLIIRLKNKISNTDFLNLKIYKYNNDLLNIKDYLNLLINKNLNREDDNQIIYFKEDSLNNQVNSKIVQKDISSLKLNFNNYSLISINHLCDNVFSFILKSN